jgi:hypothetical protein
VYAGQAALLAGADDMDRWFILASRGNSNFLVFQGILSVFYRAFGVDDLTARLVSAGFAILTVPVIYMIGRLLYGRRAGFFAALAFGISGYAIALGRLALLDSALTFFGSVAVLCLLSFCRYDRAGWLYGFMAAAALAVQTKVIGVLLIPMAVMFALADGMRPRMPLRRLAIAGAVGAVFLLPAIIQLVANTGQVTGFLANSVQRSSGVPWYFYAETLWSYEGAAMTAVFVAGVVGALVRRSRDDLIPVLWLVVILAFLHLYPLKGFNYLLLVVPALALLAGRAVGEAWDWAVERGARHRLVLVRVGTAVPVGALAFVLAMVGVPSTQAAVQGDDSAGLREAARWLAGHTEPGSGVMTMSHGSAQYVMSFYGGVDAYPFGQFNLDTIVPGGKIVRGGDSGSDSVGARDQPSQDWVSERPHQLIEDGTVSYLVYYTGHVDDPPTPGQIVGSSTERQFRRLIEAYDGKLVHRVYWRHEARVYIYEITKRRAQPTVEATVTGNQIHVKGQGFVFNSPVQVVYEQKVIGQGRAGEKGEVSLAVALPRYRQPSYHLIVTDAAGNRAAATGLQPTEVTYAIDKRAVVVDGVGYTPGSAVTVSYFQQPLGRATVGPDGRFTFSFRVPARTQEHYRIQATDENGRTASITYLPAAVVVETMRNGMITVTGQHFFPGDDVTVRYQDQVLGSATADHNGSFELVCPAPAETPPQYQLEAADNHGRAHLVGVTSR